MSRDYICTQCRQSICDVSGLPGPDVCATCSHLPGWLLDPQLRKTFHYDPYPEACLRAFAQALFKDWPDVGADGFELQELGEKYGLLTPVPVTERCDPDNCNCAEYDDFPMICYRKSPLLTGKSDA